MTQPLWYIREQGSVSGPFPVPQIRQACQLGELRGSDQVSLDGDIWISIDDAGILDAASSPPGNARTPEEVAWQVERERARLRWLNDAVERRPDSPAGSDPLARKLLRHEAQTRTLLSDRLTRRPAVLAGLIALLVVAVLGIGIWSGQSGEAGIRAAVERKLSRCEAPAAEAVSWAGCAMSGRDLRGANLRNANLGQTLLDRADLTAADLSYATLDGAVLRGANLRGARLRGISAMRADLAGADLRDADLEFAVLTGARLDGVRLEGARLGKATFSDGRQCAAHSNGRCD